MSVILRDLYRNASGCKSLWLAECCFTEIVETIVILYGDPPETTREYRRLVVALCVRRDDKFLSSLVDLSSLSNGNWQNHRETEVYVPHGSEVDKKELAPIIAERMTKALLPRLFRILEKDIFACIYGCLYTCHVYECFGYPPCGATLH